MHQAVWVFDSRSIFSHVLNSTSLSAPHRTLRRRINDHACPRYILFESNWRLLTVAYSGNRSDHVLCPPSPAFEHQALGGKACMAHCRLDIGCWSSASWLVEGLAWCTLRYLYIPHLRMNVGRNLTADDISTKVTGEWRRWELTV